LRVTFIGVFKLAAKLNPRFGLVAMLSLMASVALLGASPRASASPRTATTIEEAFADVGRDASPAQVAAGWKMTSADHDPGFTERLLGDDRAGSSAPNENIYVAEGTAPPAPETPSEARVPEPTTLALLVSGMIAMARAARRKWSLHRTHARRIGRALTEEAV